MKRIIDYLVPSAEILARFFSFLVILFLARILPPEDYGEFQLVASMVLIISVFMDGGINHFVFNLSLKNDLKNLSNLYSSRIILSLISLALLWSFVLVSNPGKILYVVLYGLIIFFSSNLMFIKFLARGRSNLYIDLACILNEPLLRASFIIAIALSGLVFNLTEIYWLLFGIGLTNFIVVTSISKRFFPIQFQLKRILNTILETLKSTKFYLLYYLAMIGIQRFDLFYMNNILGASSVALYASAFNIHLTLQLFFRSFLSIRFKQVANATNFWNKQILYAILLGILFVVAVTLTSGEGLKLLYPKFYWTSSTYLNLLSLTIPAYILEFYFIYSFNFRSKEKLTFFVFAISLITKLSVLQFGHISSLVQFCFVYIGTEVLTVLLFIIFHHFSKENKIENSSDK